tara:strand:- start:83 stop:757 length:675 start_codon:yes stop_codon:yes gene_type:complete
MNDSVLIVGVGDGLSASLARLFSNQNMNVLLASRNIDKLKDLKEEINSTTYQCDSTNIESVSNLFLELDKTIGTPNLVIYNAAARVRGDISELDSVQTQKAIEVTCFGAFLVAKESAKRMLKRGNGSIFFTGATAGVKGFANSSVFAMGKFGLRGLAQSLARELHPKNIHIGHFVIDGGIGRESDSNYQMMHPDAIAQTYLDFYNQDSSAWAWEIELRTFKEKF